MSAPLVLAAAAGVAGVGVPVAYVKHHAKRQGGVITVLWRLFTASRTVEGEKPTDRTLFRPCTPTPQHDRASHLWQRPRIVHLGARTGPPATLLAVLYGLAVAYALTLAVLASTTAATILAVSWWGYRRARTWHHRRNHEAPAAAHVGNVVGYVPRAEITRKDGATSLAKFTWLPEAEIREAHKPLILEAVQTRTGIEAPDVTWKLEGRNRVATFTPSAPPPSYVTYEDVAPAVEAAAHNALVFGIGKKGALIKASYSESPHIAIPGPSGNGKSNLTAFLVLQELMRGSLVFNLDPKWISHLWLQNLPNVINAHSPADMHVALVWLGKELDRRTRAAYASAAGTGRVRGSVGCRIVVVCEELNYGMPDLKDHWQKIRTKEDPKRSPALAALQGLSCAGRASDIHELLVAQLLTVESTGVKDSTVRSNAGIKAMVNPDPAGWGMVVGKHITMPPQTTHAGRIQLVTGQTPSETQVPYLHLDDKDEEVGDKAVAWARDLAVSGKVAKVPIGGEYGLPEALWPTTVSASVPINARLAITAGQGLVPPGQGPNVPGSVPALLTVPQAIAEGIFGTRNYEAVRQAIKRAANPPVPVRKGKPGRPHEYDRNDLIAFAKELDQ